MIVSVSRIPFLLVFAGVVLGEAIPERYVIELSAPPAASVQASLIRSGILGRLNSHAAVESQRNRVHREQAVTARAVSRKGGVVLGATDTVLNALIVQMPGQTRTEAVQRLRALQGVTNVTPDRWFQPKLDRALSLANFADASARVGIDNAGAGIRIAILDSGIDSSHPGFQDDGLSVPDGFPRASSDANKQFVTKKVIVVRSYEDLAGDGYGSNAGDVNGHGTNAACAAACVVHKTPIGVISGAAPKAFLGAYKVLGNNGSGSTSAILKGIDDAVKDGFDVLNLSLGNELTGDPAEDVQVKAVNAAADAGVIIAAAAGNEGPDENSIDSPGFADKVISVGSSSSDRSFDENANPVPIDPRRISSFSSRGPSLAGIVKPDMVSVGDNFYVAASSLHGSYLYTITQGTSFATPTVAGGAAFLKGARPGLTPAQYRSLLVNSSTQLKAADTGKPIHVRYQGAGRMNMLAMLDQPVAVEPVSINFGRGSDTVDLSKDIKVWNVSGSTVNYSASIESYDGRPSPVISAGGTASVAPGQSATLTLALKGSGMSGEYEGAIVIANDQNSVVARIPYLFVVPSTEPASISVFKAPSTAAAGSTVNIFIRVVDTAGVEIAKPPLEGSVVAGDGLLNGAEQLDGSPGIFIVQFKMGSTGQNTFRLKSGSVTRDVSIQVQ